MGAKWQDLAALGSGVGNRSEARNRGVRCQGHTGEQVDGSVAMEAMSAVGILGPLCTYENLG